MNVSVEELSPLVRKVTITIEAEAVTRRIERNYAELRKEAKLPGFRKGKVPRKVLEEHFAAEVVEQAAGELIRESVPKALLDQGLQPVADPELEPGKLRRGKPFEFSVTIELMPEIEVGNLDDLQLSIAEVEVADADVEAQVESMRQQGAELVPVDEVRPVGDGDVADVKLTLRTDGYPDHELEQIRFGLPGDESAEFMRQLVIGTSPGESRTGTVDVPMSYPDPIWAGAHCEATVEVNALARKDVPELDDEFASKMGHSSVTELRAAIRERLGTVMSQRARLAGERELLEQVIANNPFDVPKALLERRAQVLLRAITTELIPGSANQETSLDDLEDDKRADLLREAEFAVRREMVLQAIARIEGLEPTEGERIERIAAIAGQTMQTVDAIRGYMEEGGGMVALDARILEDKALAVLVGKVERK